MLCNECPKRDTCIELCEAAEEFVDQDYINRKEALALDFNIYINDIEIEPIITIDLLETKDWIVLLKKVKNLTKKQKRVVYLYYWKGLYQHQIAKKYDTTQSNICNILRRARLKMKSYIFP